MARHKGTVTQPNAGKSTGPGVGNKNGQTFGHRSGQIQLKRGQKVTGPFVLDRAEIERLYEEGGPARIQRELLLDHIEVRARFKGVLDHLETQLREGVDKHEVYNKYARTFDMLTKTAAGIAGLLRDVQRDGVIDYEQVLEAKRDDTD